MASPPEREDVGLPRDAAALRLLHNRAARCTLVEAQARHSPISRLFWRAAGGLAYALVGEPDPEVSYEDALTCRKPVVFARCSRCKRDGSAWAGFAEGIVRIDLDPLPPRTTWLDLSGILPKETWISRLLRVDDSGTTLEAVVSFPEIVGPPLHKQVRHAICAIDMEARDLHELDALPGVFF